MISFDNCHSSECGTVGATGLHSAQRLEGTGLVPGRQARTDPTVSVAPCGTTNDSHSGAGLPSTSTVNCAPQTAATPSTMKRSVGPAQRGYAVPNGFRG